jgi:hypothetical protein
VINELLRLSPKNQLKRGGRRARQNKSPVEVVTLSQTEAFEKALSQRTADSTNVRGKFLITFSATSTPAPIIAMNPISLGGRAATLNTLFSQFRFKYIRIKYLSVASGVFVNSVISLLDDASIAEGDAPTTMAAMLEQRCSSSQLAGTTIPTFLDWSPTDQKKWFYTFGGSSGSDLRLTVPAILYGATSAAGSINLEIDYSVTFKGAVDVLST